MELLSYKKKFITNISSFVQESVKDDFVKQNLLYKLTELLKSKMNEKEYNDKIEEIIKELFDKFDINKNGLIERNEFLSLIGVDVDNLSPNNVNIDIDKAWNFVLTWAKGRNVDEILRVIRGN